ncbi:MAG TPA: hypothetical protein VL069_16000 [Opitutus sp.]|nr:hypothetical protein [Opitutus sp.]
MQPKRIFTLKFVLLVVAIVALVSAPFVIWGDAFVLPLLESHVERTSLLIAIAIVLLAADSVAPVPATLVIMFLAAHSGRFAGILGGTIGMSAGVLTAAWIGRTAVGRLAPKFFPDAELVRMRAGLQRNLALTLACWRSVPVLAETSVILAAAAGIPIRRIFWVTLLPNFIISVIYSVAADDSLGTAALAFLLIITLSLGLWLMFRGKAQTAPTT